MKLYGIASVISCDIGDFAATRERAERTLAETLHDEPSLHGLIWVETIDVFGPARISSRARTAGVEVGCGRCRRRFRPRRGRRHLTAQGHSAAVSGVGSRAVHHTEKAACSGRPWGVPSALGGQRTHADLPSSVMARRATPS
jgi:hypothetical protein